jgi:hypothetical protein
MAFLGAMQDPGYPAYLEKLKPITLLAPSLLV